MSFSGANVQEAVEVAKVAAFILPKEGKLQVFEHILSDLALEELKKLSPEA